MVLNLIKISKLTLIFPFLLILVCTSNTFIPLSLIQKSILLNHTSVPETLEMLTSQENTRNTLQMKDNSLLIDEFSRTPNSLLRYLEASEKEHITISRSLTELLQTTPESFWRTVKVNLIISFTSRQKMLSSVVSDYDPEYMAILPIAIFDTTLDSIDDVKSIPGVKGIFLDEHFPLTCDNTNNNDIAIFPSENIIGARYLQNIGINGSGVTIAILDTGIDKTHPDLDDIDNDDSTDDPKVILEASFIDFDNDGINDTNPKDDHYHGTHVAGIAAANGYIKGIAPGATLMNGKVLDKTIGGYTSWIVKGIDWAVSNEADIISMSLGGTPGSTWPLYEVAINEAWKQGTIVVAAAGNSGPEPSSISSPGLESRTITVGASNVYNDVTAFSSRGPSPNGIVDPDIIAPGQGILSLDLRSQYTIASGTSMATPAVAGVIALLLSAEPGANPDEIRSALLSSASDVGRHVFEQGAGLINATAALKHLQNSSVFAYPAFTSSSPLLLSPGECFEYQLDIFLNQSFNSLNVTPSNALKSIVNISLIDLETEGWVRARVEVIMPDFATNGVIMIKDENKVYYSVSLNLKPDKIADDADSGTDAGETYIGALPVIIGTYITGEIHKWDRDLYSFPVVKDQVYSVELFNLTGNLNLFITDENGTIFNQSARTGHLPEKAIFKAQSSGYYFIRIEDKTPGRYVLVVQEKSEASLFSLQPAFLTGKMGSSLIDSNSNNLFDELLFSIEINVSEAGKYNFWYSIAQNYSDYHFGKYVFMWDWLNLTLAEGIQNLSISIPGGILESSKYNGSYIINELALGKNNFSQVLNYDLEAYTTPIHEYTSFEPLNNRLNSFNVEMKDIDGNKVPEKIKIDLEFEFTIIGAYAIAIPIWNENQNELLAYNNKTFFVSQSGLTTITIEFVIQRFHKVGSIVLFGVAGSWYDYLIPVFNPISKETLVQSDPIIDYIVTDSLIDSDNDQKPDMIRFNIEITSKIELKINIFTGHPFSNPNETMILISSSKQSISIKKGSNDLWIDFDARILKAKELSGPFFFPNFGIRIKDYEFNLYFPYVTNEYTSSSFELPEVWLSSFFGGTKFKNSTNAGLEFTWEIGSTYQGKMTFEFEVREYEPLQGTFTKAINFTKQINIGTFNITSRIEAEYLFHSNYIGGLELYFACIYYLDSQDGLKHRFQENNLTVVDFVFHAGILPDVDYKDYTAYVDAYFTRSPEIKTVINASNGRYDGILVNVTLGINRVGTYELIVNLFSKNDYLIQNITKKTKLFASETGNRSISFLFSAKIIVRNSFNKVVYGNVTITNLDTLNKSGLNIPHFIIDNDNFNYKLPVYLISIVSDYTLDDDQDGKLDAIIVEMSVNVSKENDYRFSIEVYAQLNDFYEAYLGKIAISSKYFLVNLHSISFIIPYYYFLDVSREAEDLHKLPIIEIFFMPIYMFDDEGQFTASSEPIFLKNSYDLRDFNTQPLAIGYFRITQEDINGDGISDQLGVNVAIIVHSILNYSLQVTLEVFWGKSANTLEKVIYYYPITTGIAYKTISFAFSEIFSSSNPPRHFSAKASISVVSLDGIEIDTYVTPVDILFYYESSSEITTSMITTSTEMSSQSKAYLEVFYTILAFLGVTGVKTIRDRKYRRKKEKMNYLN